MIKFLYFAVLFQCGLFAQNAEKACVTIKKINTLIKDNHYKPKAIDDSLSVFVYDNFLEYLDEEKILFTETEISKLKKHRLKIDNYIIDKDCSFLDEIANTYKTALQRTLSVVEGLEQQSIILNTKDTLFFTKKNVRYLKDEADVKRFIKKKITYEILIDIAQQSKDKDSLTANFATISEVSRAKIFENYKCKLNGLIKEEKTFYSSFLSSFYVVYTNFFDPHTTYLSYNDKVNFISSVSADNSSIGILFQLDDKDNVIVAEIIPGSPAFDINKIDTGDQLLKVKHKKDEFFSNCASLEKISELLSSDNFKTLEITLRKKNGEVFTVSLEKRIMKATENLVYSFVIENADKKVGYIKIPSFYNDENGTNTLSNDVAREIIKLQEDKVSGIIIDLDDNGGGSVTEAMKLVGMFIDIGPIAIMNDKFNNIETLKDYNRGVVYNGPMVVIVNGFSASSSEFFANAIQDYNRGIIVGNPTYGKASMQSIIPFEETYSNQDFVKITGQKFYRITGKSSQKEGVIPSVKIPYLFNDLLPRESSSKNVLENDTIVPKLSFKKCTNDFAIAIENSSNRIKNNPYFTEIEKLNKDIYSFVNEERKPLLLKFSTVFDEVHKSDKLYTETEKISTKSFGLLIKNNSSDIEKIKFDEYLKKDNAEKIKLIDTNGRIYEAVNIIHDLTH